MDETPSTPPQDSPPASPAPNKPEDREDDYSSDDDDDEPPLHAALAHGARYELIVRILQADPTGAAVFDTRHELPLHVALRKNAPPEVISSLLDFYPAAITEVGPDGRSPMRMALDYADRDGKTAAVAVLNRHLGEMDGGTEDVQEDVEESFDETEDAVVPLEEVKETIETKADEVVEEAAAEATAEEDPVGFRTPPSSRCLRESFDSAMRSGKAKEEDATRKREEKAKNKTRRGVGRMIVAGVGKGLRDLAVASSAVVAGAALAKLAARRTRRPRAERWTARFLAKRRVRREENAAVNDAPSTDDAVEGWKPWFLQNIEPSRFDAGLEYVEDAERFEEETTPSGLLIPVHPYDEDHGYEHEYEYEEEMSSLLIPVHVVDDDYYYRG